MGRTLVGTATLAVVTVLAEVEVFILVAGWVGAGWALLAVLVASLAGLALLRREGGRAWRRLRAAAAAGQPPGEQVSDGLVGLGGALLLAVPGLLTGALGALLLVPPVRRRTGGWLARMAQRRLSSAMAGEMFGPRRVRVRRGTPRPAGEAGPPGTAGSSPTIDGEIVGPADDDD